MPAVWEQGYQAGAKQGTVFFGEGTAGSWGNLSTDLSQELSDITVGTNCIYASSDARFNVSGPRTIFATITLDNNDTGYIFFQGAAFTRTSIRANGSGGIFVEHNGSTLGTLTTGVDGTADTIHLAWVTEPNPDTTGASDAYISWIIAYNVTGSTALRAGPWTHTAKNSSTTLVAYGAADSSGTSAFTGTITRAAFHHRAMTLREIVSDFVTAAGTLSTDVATSPEALPYTLDMGLGDRNDLHGPSTAWAGHNHHQLRRRTVTGRSMPLAPEDISSTYHTSNSRVRPVAWDSTYRWRLGWLWAVPVPPTVSHLWVRLHADLWVTSGAAVPVGLRVYSANRPPQLADAVGAESYVHTYIGDVVTRDDGGSGSGEWTIDGLLPITRGREGSREGWTYVLIGYAIDPAAASANDANARLRINAIQLAPCYVPPSDGEGPALPGEAS